jgi:hypothetical protein
MRLVLWGDRAIEFDADSVRAMDEKESVIAIFVGTLPKTSRGKCYDNYSFRVAMVLMLCLCWQTR